MANTLRFKRGLAAGLPASVAGEPLFTTDTFDLYIGNGTTNTRFQQYIASGTTAQYLRGDGSLATFPTDIVTGTGISGQVAYWSGTNTQTGNNNLFWDITNGRLGIGTNAPILPLSVFGSAIIGQSNAFATLTVGKAASANYGANIIIHGYNNTFKNFEIGVGSQASNFSITPSSADGGNTYTTPALSISRISNISIGATTDSGQRLQVYGDTLLRGSGNTSATATLRVQNSDTLQLFSILNNGNIGIPDASLSGYSLNVNKSITGSIISAGIWQNGSVLADVSTVAIGIYNFLRIQASTAINSYQHFRAESAAFGAGATLGTQIGFIAENSLTGATNNYGFYGNIASGTGRWNLYMNGTAANFISGNTRIGGTATDAGFKLDVEGTTRMLATASRSFLFGTNTDNNLIITTTNSAGDSLSVYENSTDANNAWGVGRSNAGTFTVVHATGATYGVGTLTNRFLIDTSGNIGIGNATPSSRLYVQNSSNANVLTLLSLRNNFNSAGTGVAIDFIPESTDTALARIIATRESLVNGYTSFNFQSWDGTSNTTAFYIAGTAARNVGVGTNSPAYKLDVQGTLGATGAATFSSSVTAASFIPTSSTAPTNGMYLSATNTLGFATASTLNMTLDGSGYLLVGGLRIKGTDTNNTIYAGSSNMAITAEAGYNISIGRASNTTSSININTTTGNLGIGMTPSYALDVTGEARVSSAIAIGTTPDTNKPFKILKNINATVGINFENTSTGSSAFSAIQMGTDVTGGTAFTNLVYGSSGISEAGVYKPSGTSLVNTGLGGLNFLAVSQPIRFFTSSGNGTLRASITNDGDYTQFNGTNPSASTTDAFRMYSADVVAGNAAPHFRTENGAVVKLYQETTGVGNAIFSAGGGNSVLDDSTFDGYTLRQIVKALRNQGILA